MSFGRHKSFAFLAVWLVLPVVVAFAGWELTCHEQWPILYSPKCRSAAQDGLNGIWTDAEMSVEAAIDEVRTVGHTSTFAKHCPHWHVSRLQSFVCAEHEQQNMSCAYWGHLFDHLSWVKVRNWGGFHLGDFDTGRILRPLALRPSAGCFSPTSFAQDSVASISKALRRAAALFQEEPQKALRESRTRETPNRAKKAHGVVDQKVLYMGLGKTQKHDFHHQMGEVTHAHFGARNIDQPPHGEAPGRIAASIWH